LIKPLRLCKLLIFIGLRECVFFEQFVPSLDFQGLKAKWDNLLTKLSTEILNES